jgi:two-component system KDP operon response regulator KdpE
MLPDIDGFDLCRRIRAQTTAPIVILSARHEEDDKVRGLRLGADDYVTKPFGAAELLARVDAILRREYRSADSRPNRVELHALTIDLAERRVSLSGQPVELTPIEYRLLEALAMNPGRVLTHDDLLRQVWGSGYGEPREVLHTTVLRLRRKLGGRPGQAQFVHSIRGIGYSLARPGPSVSAS